MVNLNYRSPAVKIQFKNFPDLHVILSQINSHATNAVSGHSMTNYLTVNR